MNWKWVKGKRINFTEEYAKEHFRNLGCRVLDDQEKIEYFKTLGFKKIAGVPDIVYQTPNGKFHTAEVKSGTFGPDQPEAIERILNQEVHVQLVVIQEPKIMIFNLETVVVDDKAYESTDELFADPIVEDPNAGRALLNDKTEQITITVPKILVDAFGGKDKVCMKVWYSPRGIDFSIDKKGEKNPELTSISKLKRFQKYRYPDRLEPYEEVEFMGMVDGSAIVRDSNGVQWSVRPEKLHDIPIDPETQWKLDRGIIDDEDAPEWARTKSPADNRLKSILPCPFCSSTDLELCRPNPYICWVECTACKSKGAADPVSAAAINNWNSRLEPTQAEIVDDDEKR